MTRKNDQRNSSQINRTGISVILRICPNKLRSSENKHTRKQSIFTHTEARVWSEPLHNECVTVRGGATKPGNRAGKGYARRQARACVSVEASARGAAVWAPSVGGMYTESFHGAALAARHVRQ